MKRRIAVPSDRRGAPRGWEGGGCGARKGDIGRGGGGRQGSFRMIGESSDLRGGVVCLSRDGSLFKLEDEVKTELVPSEDEKDEEDDEFPESS